MRASGPTFPRPEELIRSIPLAAAVLDRELRYLAHNREWATLFGVGDRSLVGAHHSDLIAELGETWADVPNHCLSGEALSDAARRVVRASGAVDHIDFTIAPWKEPDGSLGGVVMYVRVVTERESAASRLEEEQAFVRAFFERSPVGLNLCRLDGLWVESNPAFLAIIGYTSDEADGGLTYWELTPREYDEAEREQLHHLETHGRYGPYEKEFIRKDGRRVPVRLHGFLIERDGERYIWSLIEDLTEQRALQASLERDRLRLTQAAKLASIGELAAGIAHEINNPLQVIESSSYVLRESLARGEAPNLELLDHIRYATDRAARIVAGLRKFAREDAGHVTVHEVSPLVEEAVELVGARMRNHGVKLDVSVRTKASVKCGGLELTQVLVNLLNNAFDAVREDRGSVQLDVTNDDGQVVFSVFDDGPGVPAEIVDRVFEPFVTSKAPGDGTGLGLSISHGIMSSMGGTLTYGREGDRTCFRASLPSVEGA